MEYQEAVEQMGRDDVEVTFGCSPFEEIVGPVEPDSVYYGKAFGYSESERRPFMRQPLPLTGFNFTSRQRRMPPWEDVEEFLIRGQTETGEVVEITFSNAKLREISQTHKLVTVVFQADAAADGKKTRII